MKKHINIFILFSLIFSNFYGQGHNRKSHEKVTSAKISYISDELSLTSEQAEKFWPVYKSLRDDVFSLYEQKRDLERNIDHDNITEEEAKIIVEKIVSKNEEINLKKGDFVNQLSTILNYKQLLKLNRAEHKFKKRLLERIKKEH